jgi:hypothetical protein
MNVHGIEDKRILMKALLSLALLMFAPISVYREGSSRLVSILPALPQQTPCVVAKQLSHFMPQPARSPICQGH